MVWLVMLLPAAVVVAGFVTLGIAIKSGGNDGVPEAVHRTAQIQTAELGPEDRARRRGLRAVLQVQADGLRVLPVQGDFERTDPLRLTLTHPLRADRDTSIELQPDASGWHAQMVVDPTHDWQLQLAPHDAAWRIHGRLPAGQQAAHLASSLRDGGD
nr:FixH family protein [Chiayiivirga flava]